MMARLIASITVLVVLTGCGAPPPTALPEVYMEPPESWLGAQAEAGSLSVEWWTQFADVHLDSLIDEALTHNHDLRAAVARIDAARAQARITGSSALPQVHAGVTGSAAQNSLIGFHRLGRAFPSL